MTSFDDLFKRFLVRTGDYVGAEPDSAEKADLRSILNMKARQVLVQYPWPFRKKVETVSVYADGENRFIEFPEGELLGVYDSDPTGRFPESWLDLLQARNGKLYLPLHWRGGESAWIERLPPAPDFLGENPEKLRDELCDAILEYALADRMEADGQNDKAAYKRQQAGSLLELEMAKYDALGDNRIGITRR